MVYESRSGELAQGLFLSFPFCSTVARDVGSKRRARHPSAGSLAMCYHAVFCIVADAYYMKHDTLHAHEHERSVMSVCERQM